ncbi:MULTISPECIES: hypothetical protein [unclassified Clostridium]|uniref:hypothetical protein n=1 Tax=unclassified Clostridium TaxID=2614128 RepID=UPI001899579A|nr:MULTISPECIES: hypothetical protein [unclassified Clostridium]MCR1952440.1 hypothetical protein [Clostridium sp. DSM 100503]
MERISSSLFMLSLLFYYIPKIFKIKKINFVKTHIYLGTISVLAMCFALIQKIGQDDFIKYIGFTGIMIAIGVTGYFSTKKPKTYKKPHIICTVGFFVYLFTVIAILK